MYSWMLSPFNCFPSPIYIIGVSPGKSTNYGDTDFFSNKSYCLKIAGGANRKASLNNIYAKLFQLLSYLQFFLDIQCSPRRLLPVPQCSIKYNYLFHS